MASTEPRPAQTAHAARYDLHTHSVFSDGTTRPADIAQEVAASGLAGFALTDHDTIDGWDEARDASRLHRVEFLPGIEITTKFGGQSRHLLAYGIDPSADELFEELAEVRTSRLGRAREMVRRIAADYAITWEAVVGADDRTIGRPHIADALVTAGYFADRGTAFQRVLHPGTPYYIGTYAIDTVHTIHMVRAAGGVAVLAHPAAERQRGPVTPTDLTALYEAGLFGVELEHPEHRRDWLPTLEHTARELGLVVTGSSDYHGAGKSNRLGEHSSSRAVFDRIRESVATPE